MSDPNLERLRSDLQTIHEAAGLDFPYLPVHVRAAFVLALSGLACAAWAWFARDLALPLRMAGFLSLLFAPVIVYACAKRIPAPCDSRRVRSESGFSIPYLAVSAGGLALMLWLVLGYGLPPKVGLVVLCATQAVYWCTVKGDVLSLGIVLLPLLWFWTPLPLDVLVALFLAAGSLGRAAAWRHELKTLGQWE
ncbi:MAG: hypothetical protein ACM336_05655 [Acidobacteriota bacterium]